MTFTIEDTRIPARIRSRIAIADEGCWEFTGTRSKQGYGVTTVNGRQTRVHRFVWESLVNPIPDGLVIDHLCRNKSCCNPAHLEPVTNRVNVLRGLGPSARNARKTHCVNGHEFTPDNLIQERLPHRACRKCRSDEMTASLLRRIDDDDWLYLDDE